MKARRAPRVLATLSLLAAVSVAPAHAMSVSYYLDQSNVSSYPDGTNYLQVTIADGTGGNIDFTVQGLASLGSGALIDSFGFNTALSLTAANIVGLPASWGVDYNKNQDGFGKFVSIVDVSGSGTVNPLTFSITGISGDTPMSYVMLSTGTAGQGNTYFAAHVKGLTLEASGSAYFGGSAPVPEADTWAMMMAGLGLVGLRLRKRMAGAHRIRA